MSADESITKLFELHDIHNGEIKELSVGHGIMEHKVKTLHDQFHVMSKDITKQHAELKHAVTDVGDNVKLLSNDYHERQGSKKITRWVLPVIVSIGSIAVATVAVLST